MLSAKMLIQPPYVRYINKPRRLRGEERRREEKRGEERRREEKRGEERRGEQDRELAM